MGALTAAVVTDRDQLLSIPRPALDPRRPFGKPTKAQQEEMLMPYDPILPADPRWVVSHTLDLVGASAIATASTLLESSALVVVYGHDVFAALVTPSGSFDVLSPTFNRLQLLLTLVGLAAGIVVTRPMVRQKQLRSRWYDPS